MIQKFKLYMNTYMKKTEIFQTSHRGKKNLDCGIVSISGHHSSYLYRPAGNSPQWLHVSKV